MGDIAEKLTITKISNDNDNEKEIVRIPETADDKTLFNEEDDEYEGGLCWFLWIKLNAIYFLLQIIKVAYNIVEKIAHAWK